MDKKSVDVDSGLGRSRTGCGGVVVQDEGGQVSRCCCQTWTLLQHGPGLATAATAAVKLPFPGLSLPESRFGVPGGAPTHMPEPSELGEGVSGLFGVCRG